MSEIFTLESVVSYWDVDRDQVMTLAAVFKLLQEAAIKHADVYGLGAKAMATHGESWVLNRVAAEVRRYPRYEERITVRTWSAGIRGFRGYRDLRVYCGEELVVSASTLWLYINLQTKSLARVPAELAERLPTGSGEVFRSDLEKVRHAAPGPDARRTVVSLRYSDFDGNAHLNNTAYLDCLQTALAAAGLSPRPKSVELQYLREVAVETRELAVALSGQGPTVEFAFQADAEPNALGRAAL